MLPPQQITIGQTWQPRDVDGHAVQVTNVLCVGGGSWDYDVHYQWYADGTLHRGAKNAYFFQANYFLPGHEQPTSSIDEVQRQSVWRK